MTNKDALIKKYGSEEGVSEHYREMQRKAMQHPNNAKGTAKSGFNDKEVAKRAGELGRAKRWRKANT